MMVTGWTAYAARVGHVAAREAVELLGPKGDCGVDPDRWMTGGRPATADQAETYVQALGRYVQDRIIRVSQAIGGEQLYNKARELGIHNGIDYWEQPYWWRKAYDLFGLTVSLLIGDVPFEADTDGAAVFAAPVPANDPPTEGVLSPSPGGYAPSTEHTAETAAAAPPPAAAVEAKSKPKRPKT